MDSKPLGRVPSAPSGSLIGPKASRVCRGLGKGAPASLTVERGPMENRLQPYAAALPDLDLETLLMTIIVMTRLMMAISRQTISGTKSIIRPVIR